MGSLATTTGAYLRDAFRVWPFPVSTFRQAGRRMVPLVALPLVLTVLVVASFLLDLAAAALLGASGAPDGFVASLPGMLLFRWLQAAVFFFAAGAFLFGVTRLFGATASLSQFYSAWLVFPSIGVAVSVLLAAVLVLMLLTSSDTPGMLALLAPAREVGGMALAFVLAGYTILAARFGADLGWPAAVASAFIYFAAMVFLQVAYMNHVLGISSTPGEIAGWLFFGTL